MARPQASGEGGQAVNREAQTSNQEYLIRCYASILARNPADAQPPQWRKANELESRWPIYIVFAVDRAGIHLSCAPTKRVSGFAGFENNAERYRLLTSANGAEPVTVPLSYFDLYYVPYQRRGDFISTTTPAKQPGYVGALPSVGGFDVRIAIIYSSLRDPCQDGRIIKRDPPLQLDLMVVDLMGQDDPAATREFYHALLKAQTSNDQPPGPTSARPGVLVNLDT